MPTVTDRGAEVAMSSWELDSRASPTAVISSTRTAMISYLPNLIAAQLSNTFMFTFLGAENNFLDYILGFVFIFFFDTSASYISKTSRFTIT